jgi:hypothetical protein
VVRPGLRRSTERDVVLEEIAMVINPQDPSDVVAGSSAVIRRAARDRARRRDLDGQPALAAATTAPRTRTTTSSYAAGNGAW